MKKNLLTPHEKIELLKLIEKLPTTTPCIECKKFENGYCMAADSIIPEDVMENGCEVWEFDPTSPPF